MASAAAPSILRAPEANSKSREQKRFGRADKDDDGRITSAEMFEPRRKAFAKLDKNGNGSLDFEEWAAKTVDKFQSADADRSGYLSATEFVTTAPRPPKRKPARAAEEQAVDLSVWVCDARARLRSEFPKGASRSVPCP